MFVLPLEVDNPTRHGTIVLPALIGINLFVYAVSTQIYDHQQVVREYGLVPAHFTILTLITSMFLHANIWHLLGNMLFLYMFGDNIEDVMGGVLLLVAYVLCGLAADAAYIVLHAESTIPCIGASGAISGIIGMYLVFFPRAKANLCVYLLRWEVTTISSTVLVAVLVWFGEQALLAWLFEVSSIRNNVSIAFSAHVGGFVMGCLLGLIFLQLGFLRRYSYRVGRRHWLLGHVS